jgi:inorganic triphosphatase YgiF
MANDHLETETKYDVDPGFVMPDLSAASLEAAGAASGSTVVRGPELYRLSATYFDTEDLRLAAHGITLRRRTGGSDAGWHLKLPVRPGTRQELQEPLGDTGDSQDGTGGNLEDGTAGDPRNVPPRLAAAVAEITAGEPLAPIAILRTERTVYQVASGAGEVVAEIADDLVTAQRTRPPESAAQGGPAGPAVNGSRSALITWREIEVETSAPDLLDAAGKLLREAGARPSESGSKLSRLLSTT